MKRINVYLCVALCGLMGTSYAVTPGQDVQPSIPTAATPNLVAVTLSAQDWQEVRIARQAALKAHPELLARTAKLATQMRAFQDELNAAIIKDNPGLGLIISKMSNHHPAAPPQASPAVSDGKHAK